MKGLNLCEIVMQDQKLIFIELEVYSWYCFDFYEVVLYLSTDRQTDTQNQMQLLIKKGKKMKLRGGI